MPFLSKVGPDGTCILLFSEGRKFVTETKFFWLATSYYQEMSS